MTNLRAETVDLDPVIRLVLGLCDGSRDRTAMTAELAEVASQPDGSPAGAEAWRTPSASWAETVLLLR